MMLKRLVQIKAPTRHLIPLQNLRSSLVCHNLVYIGALRKFSDSKMEVAKYKLAQELKLQEIQEDLVQLQDSDTPQLHTTARDFSKYSQGELKTFQKAEKEYLTVHKSYEQVKSQFQYPVAVEGFNRRVQNWKSKRDFYLRELEYIEIATAPVKAYFEDCQAFQAAYSKGKKAAIENAIKEKINKKEVGLAKEAKLNQFFSYAKDEKDPVMEKIDHSFRTFVNLRKGYKEALKEGKVRQWEKKVEAELAREKEELSRLAKEHENAEQEYSLVEDIFPKQKKKKSSFSALLNETMEEKQGGELKSQDGGAISSIVKDFSAYLDPKARLDPHGLPDWYAPLRYGSMTRADMRQSFLSDREMEDVLYEFASTLEYSSAYEEGEINDAKYEAVARGMTHEIYKIYHDAKVEIEKILAILEAFDPITGRALDKEGKRDFSALNEQERLALPGFLSINKAMIEKQVDRYLAKGVDAFGVLLEAAGFSQEYRNREVNKAEMAKKRPSERKELEELQFALENIPPGTTTIDKYKELADKAYARDGTQQVQIQREQPKTLEMRELLSQSLELSEEDFAGQIAHHFRNPVGFDIKAIPEEFHDYFNQIQAQDKQKPKSALLATLGFERSTNPESLSSEEISRRIINFDHIPTELRKAARDYQSRMKKVRLLEKGRSPLDQEVDNLIQYMAENQKQQKQLTENEVNDIVKLIAALDKPPTNPPSKANNDSKLQREQRIVEHFRNKMMDAGRRLGTVLSEKSKSESKLEKQLQIDIDKVTEYICQRHPEFQNVSKNLQLDQNATFNTLMAHVYRNFTRHPSKENVLLNRLASLLIQLEGSSGLSSSSSQSFETNLQELFEAYQPTDWEGKQGAVLNKLAQDSEFMLKFRILQVAKFHNQFNQVDQIMRHFAKACTELPSEYQYMTRKLEQILNTDVVVRDPSKQNTLPLIERKREEYHTVDHGVIAQPDFAYLPAFKKLERLEQFDNNKTTLMKTREIKAKLQNADAKTQQGLMRSFGELQKLIDHLDADQKTLTDKDSRGVGRVSDFAEVKTWAKMALSVNELAAQIIREDIGVEGVSWDNMEQVYNPLLSGEPNLARQRVRLIQQGLSVDLADELCQKYLNQLVREGQVFTLMDFFTDQRAKSALHNKNLKIEDVCLNYQAMRPKSVNIKEGVAEMMNPVKMRPVRPVGAIGSIAARFFSASAKDSNREQAIIDAQMQAQNNGEQKKGKFSSFLAHAEEIDHKIETDASFAKSVEGEQETKPLDFDSSQIDIEFNFEKEIRERDELKARKAEEQFGQVEEAAEISQSYEAMKLLNMKEKRERISRACNRFDADWFKQFAYNGPVKEEMTQFALEKHLESIKDKEEFEDFLIAMINSGSEVNDKIENLELTFYKMFMSPITTSEEKKLNEKNDLLAGNLFKQEGFELPNEAYMSLLQTVALKPKKKHLKKIIQHLIRFKTQENIDPEVIDLISFIAIDQKYPILIGNTLKYFMQNGYEVSQDSFRQLVLFLERCKGFEEDAKRFLYLSTETNHIQIDYELVRPFFLRSMKYKSGQDVLQLFEQIRKNLKLNKSNAQLSAQEYKDRTTTLKKDFYNGLLNDCISKEAYKLAMVIYGEKQREKFDLTIKDHLLGLQIFAVQQKIDDFKQIFTEVTKEGGEFDLEQTVCEHISKSLRKFTTDAYQTSKLEMFDQLLDRVEKKQIFMSHNLASDFITTYTEQQQWNKVTNILRNMTQTNSSPEPRIVSYLKQNIVYILDANLRTQVREEVESLEKRFFSPEAKKAIREKEEAKRRQEERQKASQSAANQVTMSSQKETQVQQTM